MMTSFMEGEILQNFAKYERCVVLGINKMWHPNEVRGREIILMIAYHNLGDSLICINRMLGLLMVIFNFV